MAVNATAVWRARPSGSDTNGAGYDAGIAGAGTDYSQQNSAQLALTDLSSVGTTSNDVTSATGGFTAAMVGNAVFISGTGYTTGRYFITARASTTTVTLDRTPASAAASATGGTANVGGAVLTPMALAATGGQLVAGNILYIFSPNPTNQKIRTVTTSATSGTGTGLTVTIASTTNFPTSGLALIDAELVTYTRSGSTLTLTGRGQTGTTAAAAHASGAPVTVIDYATNRTATALAQGSTSGKIIIRSDPASGRPALFNTGATAFYSSTNAYLHFENLAFLWNRPTIATAMMIGASSITFKECNWHAAEPSGAQSNGNCAVNGASGFIGCVFEAETINVTPTVNSTNSFITSASLVYGCTFLNLNTTAIVGVGNPNTVVTNSLFYNTAGTCITTLGGAGTTGAYIVNNTFDNNQGNCLTFQMSLVMAESVVLNNIFSNNAGTAINTTVNTAAINDALVTLMGTNFFFNNTTNYNGISAKASDVAGTNPGYANATGGDHSIGTALKALGYPSAATSDARSYIDPGAFQRQEAVGGGSLTSPTITFVG